MAGCPGFHGYKDENGRVLFVLAGNTGICIRATVSANRRDGRSFSYSGSDSSEPFPATRTEREQWARAKLAELADGTT